MFADDLLLFGEAHEAQMQFVIDTLNTFCGLSGQEVSQEKTSILFSSNVNRGEKDKLLRISGFRETNEMGKYLGVPLLGRAPKRADYQYLVDQVDSKLSVWKAKQLSFAGRVTLAKSVIEAIPIYPMMSTRIPKTCLDDIQRLQRNFIWGDNENARRFHAVSWEKVTLPKWMGGLGIRKLDIMNQACLTKLSWKVFSGSNEYWCEVLRGKYVHADVRPTDSNLWKVLSGLKPYVMSGCPWIVGDGCSIEAWNHVWIEDGLRLTQVLTIPHDLLDAKVCDLVAENGDWNWRLFQTWMPQSFQQKIAAILPPNRDYGKDVQVGAGGSSEVFSVANMYNELCGWNVDNSDIVWKRIWKLRVTERIISFIWMVKWNRLLTNAIKHKMGLCSPMCAYCGVIKETTIHVLRDCPVVVQFWLRVLPVEKRGNFFMSNLKEWVDENINNKSIYGNGEMWCDFWALACYCFWNWKNKELHDPNFVRPFDQVQHVRKLGADYTKAMDLNCKILQRDRAITHIAWKPPRGNYVKLNTDGACKEGGRAGCGGVIRGDQGEWIGGFAKGVGICNAVTAELWGVVEGLAMAHRMGFTRIELCIDSQVVVQAIGSGNIKGTGGGSLIRKIRWWLAKDWEVEVKHTYREANKCADALANIGCSLDLNVIFYEDCPIIIRDILLADVMGITTPRMIVA